MKGIELGKIRDQIIGLKPFYSDRGDATIIYLQDGELVDQRGIRSVQKALARTYAIDLVAQRQLLEDMLNRRGVLPFYLNDNRVFVPLKMRKAIGGNDMVYGYIDVNYIGKAQEHGKKGCLLSLTEGRQIDILSSRSTVMQNQQLCLQLLDMLQVQKPINPGEQIVIDATLYLLHTLEEIKQTLVSLS